MRRRRPKHPISAAIAAQIWERVTELEATTARKGNRKVSLTVSGYVAQEITWWDDGGESNVYLHGLGPTQATHVKFTGEARIAPGWTAGYTLRIQNLDDNPFGRNAATGQAMNYLSSRAPPPPVSAVSAASLTVILSATVPMGSSSAPPPSDRHTLRFWNAALQLGCS